MSNATKKLLNQLIPYKLKIYNSSENTEKIVGVRRSGKTNYLYNVIRNYISLESVNNKEIALVVKNKASIKDIPEDIKSKINVFTFNNVENSIKGRKINYIFIDDFDLMSDITVFKLSNICKPKKAYIAESYTATVVLSFDKVYITVNDKQISLKNAYEFDNLIKLLKDEGLNIVADIDTFRFKNKFVENNQIVHKFIKHFKNNKQVVSLFYKIDEDLKAKISMYLIKNKNPIYYMRILNIFRKQVINKLN